MALPTLVKTWQYNVNQAISAGTASAIAKATILAFKNAIKGFATLPYVVRGSGNTVTGAMDSTDRWTTVANLIAGSGGSGASWIVLRQTGIGSTFDLLILCDNAGSTDTNWVFMTSTLGFTGGSASARPTATDEMSMASASLPHPGSPGPLLAGGTAAHKLHVLMSTDGTSLRWMVYSGNVMVNCGLIDRMTLPITGANYVAMHTHGSGWDVAMTNPYWMVRLSSARQIGRITQEYINGVKLTASVLKLGSITGGNIASPLGVGVLSSDSPNTVSQRCGTIPDIWETTDSLGDVTTFPSGTGRTFCKFGGTTNVMLPWNGTIPLTA